MAEKYIDISPHTGFADTQRAGSVQVPYGSLIPDSHIYLFRFLGTDLDEIASCIESFADRLFFRSAPESAARDYAGLADMIRSVHPFMDTDTRADRYLVYSAVSYLVEKHGYGDRTEDVIRILRSSLPEVSFTAPVRPSETLQHTGSMFSIKSLKTLQEALRRLLAVVFDDSFAVARAIPQNEREALYSESYGHDLPGICGKTETFRSLLLNGRDGSPGYLPGMNFADRKQPETRGYVDSVFLRGDYPDGYPGSVSSEGGEAGIRIVYRAENLYELFNIEITDMLLNRIRIRRCLKCGRYYVYREGDPKYCVIPDDETGSPSSTCRAEYLKKKVREMYLKAYKTHNQRYNRGTCTREQISEWEAEAKEAGRKLVASAISMDEYLRILKR